MARHVSSPHAKAGLLATAVLLGSAGPMGGCKFFDLSNPLVPQARLFAQPNPTLIDVKYTFKIKEQTITVEAEEGTVNVSAFPRDSSPGVTIFSYAAEYFDQSGQAVPTLLLARVNFGVSAFIPPATGGAAPTAIPLKLPMYNQQVKAYGIDQVFSFSPGVGLNRNLIHSINCKVTLFGEDDNFNQVTVPVNVPIRFDGEITQ